MSWLLKLQCPKSLSDQTLPIMSGIIFIVHEFPETLGLHHQVLVIFLQRSLNKILPFMTLDSGWFLLFKNGLPIFDEKFWVSLKGAMLFVHLNPRNEIIPFLSFGNNY